MTRTATELAAELRAQADRAREVADILDPPRRRRRRKAKAKAATAPAELETQLQSVDAIRSAAERHGLELLDRTGPRELERPTA